MVSMAEVSPMADVSFDGECRYCKRFAKQVKKEQDDVMRMQKNTTRNQEKLEILEDKYQVLQRLHDKKEKEARKCKALNLELLKGQDEINEYKTLWEQLKSAYQILSADISNIKASETNALKDLKMVKFETEIAEFEQEDLHGIIEKLEKEREELNQRLTECRTSYEKLELAYSTLQNDHAALQAPAQARRTRRPKTAPTTAYTFMGPRGTGAVKLQTSRKGTAWR